MYLTPSTSVTSNDNIDLDSICVPTFKSIPRVVAPGDWQQGGNIEFWDPSQGKGKWITVKESDYEGRFPFSVTFDVTPEWAENILLHRNQANRRIEKRRVIRYARDMILGNWQLNNDDICFFKDGNLANGQHRLAAAIVSKKIVRMSFKFGVDKSAVSTIDEGRSRSNLDVINIMGLDSSKFSLSATNYILEDAQLKHRLPRHEIIAFNQRHKEAGNFASKINRRPFHKSPVHAAFVRAYYTIPHDKLERAIHIINTGEYDASVPGELSIIKLRQFLITGTEENTGPGRKDLYYKVQTALFHYINGKDVSRLQSRNKNIYHLPEECVGDGKLIG